MANADTPPVLAFRVNARALLALGRESIKDVATAVLELVKNSYDADAEVVEIHVRSLGSPDTRYIRVADSGIGMSRVDVTDNWLVIGRSPKRTEPITERKRRSTGEKGIGRLSADCLGARLELRTKRARHPATGLAVTWSDFERDDVEISHVRLKELESSAPSLPKLQSGEVSKTGTELIVRDLRERWSQRDVDELVDELEILTPPGTVSPDFEIRFDSDAFPQRNGTVKSVFNGVASVVVDARLEVVGRGKAKYERVRYSVTTRAPNGKLRKSEEQEIPLKELVQGEVVHGPALGPCRCVLMMFPRKTETIRGTGLKLKELRTFLDLHSGVRIYRDGVRVRPYGASASSGSDWLGLGDRKSKDPAGVSRPTWRISPGQVLGSINIGRDDNDSLLDSSAREGLVHNDAFYKLRAFGIGCVTLLEKAYHHLANDEKGKPKQETTDIALQAVPAELARVASQMRAAEKRLALGEPREVRAAMSALAQATDAITAIERSVAEAASQGTTLRGLASVGIAATVFAHETQAALSQVLLATRAAAIHVRARPADSEAALAELEKGSQAARTVANWGAFALARIGRDKRRRKRLRIDSVARDIIEQLRPILKGGNVSIETHLPHVEAKTFAMDVESVLLNLMTNAYSACQNRKGQRTVCLSLRSSTRDGRQGFELVVEDSGQGVSKQLQSDIWRPLFSTKTNARGETIGTGLGLSIVSDIVAELRGHRSVGRSEALGGAQFTVWLPGE